MPNPNATHRSLWSYYKQGFNVLREHRWLAVIPFSVYGASLIFGLPQEIYFQYMVLKQNVTGRIVLAPPNWTLILAVAQRAWQAALWTGSIYKLDRAWCSVAAAIYLNFGVLILSAPWLSMGSKRLDGFLGTSTSKEKKFLFDTITVAYGCLLVNGVLLVILRKLFKDIQQNAHQIMGLELILKIGSTVALAVITSLYEAFILNAVKTVLRGDTFNRKRFTQSCVTTYRDLYGFNLGVTLGVIALNLDFYLPDALQASPVLGIARRTLDTIIALGLLTIPFFIVIKEERCLNAVRSQAKLLLQKFPAYLFFVASGIAILFVPSLFLRMADVLLIPHTFVSMDVNLLFNAIHVLLATWFMVSVGSWIMGAV